MIKKVKASLHEKLIFIFLIVLGIFALGFTVVIKNKCLLVKNFDPQKLILKSQKKLLFLMLNVEMLSLNYILKYLLMVLRDLKN
jgi:peptidyl-prolyl cis-trans isomerase A (cyclophilin A)